MKAKNRSHKTKRVGEKEEVRPRHYELLPSFKPTKHDLVVFDLWKEIFIEKESLTLATMSNLFRTYVLEYDTVITKVFFNARWKSRFTLAIELPPPKNLVMIKKIVKKRNIILEVFESQAKRELIALMKQRKWNFTEDYFETVDEVQPDSRPRKLGAEVLRATFITDMLRNGSPIRAVAQQVGHRSLQSTAKYAPRLTPAQIQKIYKKAHPKA